MDEVFNFLCSKAKIERDKGVQMLESIVQQLENDNLGLFCDKILTVMTSDDGWENKHGALMGSKVLLLHIHKVVDNKTPFVDFQNNVLRNCLILLEDKESRVRLAAGMGYFRIFS